MYNFVLAFVICAAVYVIGEIVSTLTKAWIPSVFVTAVVLLIGYWTILPKEVIGDSNMLVFAGTTGIFLLITHMGTVISLKQLMEQWKTIVVCLTGLAGMIGLGYFIGPLLIDKAYVIAGLAASDRRYRGGNSYAGCGKGCRSSGCSSICYRYVLHPGFCRLPSDSRLPSKRRKTPLKRAAQR